MTLEAPAIWYFRPGTQERVEVLRLENTTGDPKEDRWVVPCGACGKRFTIRPEHGVSVGPDGALSTERSMVCPVCTGWHVTIRGGVATG